MVQGLVLPHLLGTQSQALDDPDLPGFRLFYLPIIPCGKRPGILSGEVASCPMDHRVPVLARSGIPLLGKADGSIRKYREAQCGADYVGDCLHYSDFSYPVIVMGGRVKSKIENPSLLLSW